MITAVELHGLRGIQDGRLHGLAPLTVLTGFNGSGKSTILDALLVGGSMRPAEAVGRAIRRHQSSRDGTRWLLAETCTTTVEVDGAMCTRRFVRRDGELDARLESRVKGEGMEGRFTTVEVWAADQLLGLVALNEDNQYVFRHLADDVAPSPVRLVDPGVPHSIAASYDDLVRVGGKQRLLDILHGVAPQVRDVELLPDGSQGVSLHLHIGTRPIPSTLAGDGIHAFLQTAIELAKLDRGTLLLEEPEVYQHPRTLAASADAILMAVQRGVQVVMTTHSEELMEMLLARVRDGALAMEHVMFFLLDRREGELSAWSRSGIHAAERALDMSMDLR